MTLSQDFSTKDVLFSLSTDLCECEKSKFCAPHDKHIIAGDLGTIERKNLRKPLPKGPNYRQFRSINF